MKPLTARPVVLYLVDAYRVSERHACEVVVLPRATHRYQSDPPTELRVRMRQFAQTRIRYGYRKIRVLLIREGWRQEAGAKKDLDLRTRPKRRPIASAHSRQKPRTERTGCGVWISWPMN